MILLDTNILIRMNNGTDPHCLIVRDAIRHLVGRHERIIIVPQNLYEFWVVATRPPGPPPGGSNGLGMSPEQARAWLGFFQRRFALLPDREDVCARWQVIIAAPGNQGIPGARRSAGCGDGELRDHPIAHTQQVRFRGALDHGN